MAHVASTNAYWERLKVLFERATNLDPSEQRAFIDRETQDNLSLRTELIELLTHDQTDPDRFSQAFGTALRHLVGDQHRALIGRVVGSYRLVSVLGQGGTGTVYLGERADRQYSAQVAVKIVDHTTLHGNLGARFRAERQILASLNHPNIARLLDAGETEDGHPFLVMEYVHGETVDRYCDSARLDLPKRLELFLGICAAVQYAHQNLIVHRDLKPANILVTADGVPKLLDFGIAKLLNSGDVAEVAALTRVNDRLLTPEYASPEQILGHHVTTASDVYSLGVVLYQLVCGVRPYNVPGSASQLELERAICVSDPDRPSTAVLRMTREAAAQDEPGAPKTIAWARRCSPERLSRQLLGDIDAIVMRSLRKEPQHRYSSIEQFADDVRRYLRSEPVQARQGNWLYYGQRFARRHTLGVVASFGFLLFLAGVAIIMSIQRQQIAVALDQATQDGRRAETVSEFMMDVFAAADPFVHFGKEPTASHLLGHAARRIQVDLGQQPAVRARLLEAIGRSYRRMGQPGRAVPFLEESLLLQRKLSVSDARLGSVLTELAIAQREAAKYEESDRSLAEALDLARRSKDSRSESHAQLLVELGRLDMLRGDTQQSRRHLSAALTLMKELRGPSDSEVGAILTDLSSVLVWENDLNSAERHARAAVQIYAQVPAEHPDRIMADYRLAQILLYRNRLAEAAPVFERALTAQRQLYGASNVTVADTLASLAQVRIAQGNTDDAERLTREALDIHRDSGSTVGHQIGYVQTMLATVLLKTDRHAQAESLLRDALDVFARSLPPDHQYVASAEYYLGEALLAGSKLVDAEAMLLASMNRWRRTDAPAWRVARCKSALGEVLYRQGRRREAERYLVDGVRALNADAGADQESKTRARERVSRFYTDQRRRDELDTLLRELSEGGVPAARGDEE